MSEKKEAKEYYGFKKWEVWVLVGLLLCSIISPLVFTQLDSGISFLDTGPIGDTIGGLTAPFINLIAAFLVYKSFTAQIRANLDQRDNHNSQMKIIRKEQSINTLIYLFNEMVSSVLARDRETYKGGTIHAIIAMNNDIEQDYSMFGGNQEVFKKKKQDHNNSVGRPINTLSMNVRNLLRFVRHLEAYLDNFHDEQNAGDLAGFFVHEVNRILISLGYHRLNEQDMKIIMSESHLDENNYIQINNANLTYEELRKKLGILLLRTGFH